MLEKEWVPCYFFQLHMCGLFLLIVVFRFRRLLVFIYVWRKFVGPLFLLWRKFYVWTQTFRAPCVCLATQEHVWWCGMFGSTVFWLLGISCDSARWCNLIPCVKKKMLNAASSWPSSFPFPSSLARAPCVSSFPLASARWKLLTWGNFWVGCSLSGYLLCVWMQTFSATNLLFLSW